MTKRNIDKFKNEHGVLEMGFQAMKTNFYDTMEQNTISMIQIRKYQQRLQNFYDEYKDIICRLSDSVTTDEDLIDKEQEAYSAFLIDYGKMDVAMSNIEATWAEVQAPPVIQNVQPVSQHNKVKVPQLQLPEFDGSFEKWMQFHDTFKSLIHDNANYSDIDKFHYLRSSIKIEPASSNVINNYSFCADNYNIAWDALCKRYNSKRSLELQYAAALFNVKKVKDDSAEELRRVHDAYASYLAALKQMKLSDNQITQLMIERLIRDRIDEQTTHDWDVHILSHEATWDEFSEFLQNRATIKASNNSPSKTSNSHSSARGKTFMSSETRTSEFNCALCDESHAIHKCSKFLAKSIPERWDTVKRLRLCHNCLHPGHFVQSCTSKYSCRECKSKHHTTLHKNQQSTDTASTDATDETETDQQHHALAIQPSSSAVYTHHQTLMATVELYVQGVDGSWHKARALLDSASDDNIMTLKCAKKLGLKQHKTNRVVYGINNTPSKVLSVVTTKLGSHYKRQYEKETSFQVFEELVGQLPTATFDATYLKLNKNRKLADPKFNIRTEIDMLLGMEILWDVVLDKPQKLHENTYMIHTKFGWMITGEIKPPASQTLLTSFGRSMCHRQSKIGESPQISEQLEKFWELEQCESTNKLLTKEEQQCEQIFQQTVTRSENGQYVVDLPVKPEYRTLGDNLHNATKRFQYLEKKFDKNDKFKIQYKEFIDEYISLGHMHEINPDDDKSLTVPMYYLPHHGVIKEDSSTTKLRVVFDASCKSQSKLSLNDVLLVGPTVQNELYDTLINFMANEYCMKSDIAKMYRMVKVNEKYQPMTRIVWRDVPSQPFKHYQLNTVTYGTSCAPYLATRTLLEIANDNKEKHPKASQIIKSNFYVDDLLISCETLEECKEIQAEVTSVLRKAGMELRKWSSNKAELLTDLSADQVETIDNDVCEIKALGIKWNVQLDTFSFTLHSNHRDNVTMSSVLSEIASIYDPLGFLGPLTVVAKLFMKKLWTRKLEWTKQLPEDLDEEWTILRNSLWNVDKIQIPRQLYINQPKIKQLHGFCDASINAYAMCIYARTIDANGQIQSRLITAKSRVSPMKQITLARLELCGLLLLAKFINRVATILQVPSQDVYLWCDSLITLHWVKAEPAKLSVFVGNRVAAIQDESSKFTIKHVRSQDNPADIISRGMYADELSMSDLWWKGAPFLMQPEDTWKDSLLTIDPEDESVTQEFRKTFVNYNIESNQLVKYIETRYESPTQLFIIISKVMRVINYMKRSHLLPEVELQNTMSNRQLGEITVIKILQRHFFKSEIKLLSSGKSIATDSSIRALHPFLDKHGVIRTTGRILLCNNVSIDTKHQIILPTCSFTSRLVKHIHEVNGHAGQLSTLAFVRQQYWPLKAKSIIRKVIHHCIKCFKINPVDNSQLMGNLPYERINQAFPFSKVSVDYAGPYLIKSGTSRNASRVKAYISLFKCMTTKAIHIELVSDLSSEAFIAALDRFIARRGLPDTIFSDNATCFEGADNEFKRIAVQHQQKLQEFYDNKQIKWKFITPRAPHMGGLWEAGVKQMKYYLKRTLDDKFLTFEEFTTVLCKVESILNSRPLTQMSDDPNDVNVLTPGHFLIGRPLNAKLDEDVSNILPNRLTRWKLIQQVVQQFWQQWYDHVIIHMQERPRHNQFQENYKINDMVLMKESNLPPTKWAVGRIVALIPGKDGIVRNVRIKCQNTKSDKERHVKYLCKLPIDNDDTIPAEAGEC